MDSPAPQQSATASGSGKKQRGERWGEQEDARFVNLRIENPDMSWEEFQRVHIPYPAAQELSSILIALIENVYGPYWSNVAPKKQVLRARIEQKKASTREAAAGAASSFQDRETLSPFTESEDDSASHVSYEGGRSLRHRRDYADKPGDEPSSKRRRTLPARTRRRPVRLGYEDDAMAEDDGLAKLLDLVTAEDFTKIHQRAKACLSETKRAENALRQNAELERRLKEAEAELRELTERAKKDSKKTEQEIEDRKDIKYEGLEVELTGMDEESKAKVRTSWEIIKSKVRDTFTLRQWDEAGMGPAVNTVQQVIDKLMETSAATAPNGHPGEDVGTTSQKSPTMGN
ncbi:hypothetical protein TRV_02672 [Trichophyton verrucosum HKI 0517]|uniref:Uncharacterized protein n=1 Tax=Trichophyton verrucosum (strain HKI 0517) TaxID=663202 RepID=D4D6E7_TRIVH|nr:uncharacterized protein TRV_02672 [Trichophyton verrucosum HKI 0517]EFE42591.1 hypothetical protein TRV_02672 [Trichophyton verrucosum HKI 0517]